jgi:hypothetical protein
LCDDLPAQQRFGRLQEAHFGSHVAISLRATVMHTGTCGGAMKNTLTNAALIAAAMLLIPHAALAQGPADATTTGQPPNVPAQVQQAERAVERAVDRFRIGVVGGVGFDPELIQFGGHAAFAPIFSPSVEFRPGVEFGIGELTTTFAINLDVLYMFPGATTGTRWMPYIGAGPNFGLSHRSFEAEDDLDRNRFDFSDTDFNGGFNFVAGARNQAGMFFELKGTAWGVSSVRLLAGFNF